MLLLVSGHILSHGQCSVVIGVCLMSQIGLCHADFVCSVVLISRSVYYNCVMCPEPLSCCCTTTVNTMAIMVKSLQVSNFIRGMLFLLKGDSNHHQRHVRTGCSILGNRSLISLLNSILVGQSSPGLIAVDLIYNKASSHFSWFQNISS